MGHPWTGGRWPTGWVSSDELNRFLFNEDTVDQVLGTLMEKGAQGRRRRPVRQDDHLRQEPASRRVHSAALRRPVPEHAGALRASSPTAPPTRRV